jgi:hypothetical protein
VSKKGTVIAATAEKPEPVAVKSPASAKPLGRMYTDANPGTRARLFVDTERGKGTRIELTGKARGSWFVYVPADKDAAARVQQWLNAELQTGNKVEQVSATKYAVTILALQTAEKPETNNSAKK